MKDLKEKYIRSVIKLGNSKAITFPQDWAEKAGLKDKSEVIIYPIDDSSIVIKTIDKGKQKTVLNIELDWSMNIIKQALISAFKLDINEIYIKYDSKKQEEIFGLLTQLRGEMIGMDFKDLADTNQYLLYFLTDTSKTIFKDVLIELINTFKKIIDDVIKGIMKKNSELLLAQIDRKYSLGRRILITGLSDYPVSKGYHNLPVIQYLGNRVILLYVKDFINEAQNLQNYPPNIIKNYSDLLQQIPTLLINIITNYDTINLDTISQFHDELINLGTMVYKIKPGDTFEELELRNSIKYFLNSFKNFFDIGITRLIEKQVGLV
jgi:antitoxin component of MazEF toxin-antitoxin module